jgi:DNA-binding transcriptional regulator YhcF (GntR family)
MKTTLNIQFEDNRSVSKYRLIIDAIEECIFKRELKKGDQLPSLNSLCQQYNLSQDTVLMAYNQLKAKGVITSQVGKGYFVNSNNPGFRHNVLLLFDRLTTYKEELLESFESELRDKANIQIYFHNNNIKIFRSTIESSLGEYTEYVVMPFEHAEVKEIISQIPSKRVFILDQGRKQYNTKYPFVCQDFMRDIYRILKKNESLVNKYNRLVLVIKNQRSHFRDITIGFRDFCKQHPIDFDVVANIRTFTIKPNDAFIVVDDRDLEYLVLFAQSQNLELGVNLGIISYNETPLKKIVASGITTISTNFALMGKTMAQMIMGQQRQKIDNPFEIHIRNSF